MIPSALIVSDCNSVTHNISKYIDFFLGALSSRNLSFLKDTYHFLDLIHSMIIPEEGFLFTVDIDSLYTNINTDMGLQAVKVLFLWHPDNTRPDEEI